MIGLAKMEMKAAFTIACINMKILAILLYKLDPNKDLMLNKLKVFFYKYIKNTTNPGNIPGFVYNLASAILHLLF